MALILVDLWGGGSIYIYISMCTTIVPRHFGIWVHVSSGQSYLVRLKDMDLLRTSVRAIMESLHRILGPSLMWP